MDVRTNLVSASLRRTFASFLLALPMALPLPAHADFSRSERDVAVAIGEEGLRLFEQGDYAAALEKFEAANDLVPAPTFGLRAARCLESLGRLVDALRRYEQVAAMHVDPSWPEIHAKAQAEARKRATLLRERVGYVYVVFRGDHPEQTATQIDGKPIAYQDLAAAVLVMPGEHTIQVVFADHATRRRFHVREGEQHQETFLLTAPDPHDTPAMSSQRVIGWSSVGLGTAAVAFGTVSGLVAWNKENVLETRCPQRVCPPSAWADNESYYLWRDLSTAGFAVGIIALGTGSLLLLSDSPNDKNTNHARVHPWIAGGLMGARGTF